MGHRTAILPTGVLTIETVRALPPLVRPADMHITADTPHIDVQCFSQQNGIMPGHEIKLACLSTLGAVSEVFRVGLL